MGRFGCFCFHYLTLNIVSLRVSIETQHYKDSPGQVKQFPGSDTKTASFRELFSCGLINGLRLKYPAAMVIKNELSDKERLCLKQSLNLFRRILRRACPAPPDF